MCRLFQCDFEVVAQIRTTIDLRPTTTSTRAATEDIAKNVAERIRKSGPAAAEPAATHIRINARMTIAVICLALLRIGQHFVSLFGFLELVFGSLAIRVAVRMVFHCELAIRLFDFIIRSVLRNTQYFVIITLCHLVGILSSVGPAPYGFTNRAQFPSTLRQSFEMSNTTLSTRHHKRKRRAERRIATARLGESWRQQCYRQIVEITYP